MGNTITITKEIGNHELNKSLGLEIGSERILGGCPPEDKPAPPDGEVGEWLCSKGEWVWVPAV